MHKFDRMNAIFLMRLKEVTRDGRRGFTGLPGNRLRLRFEGGTIAPPIQVRVNIPTRF